MAGVPRPPCVPALRWAAEVSATVDGGTATAMKAISEYGGLVEAAVELATGPDGKIDRGKLGDSAKHLAVDTGMCVLADFFARHLSPHADAPNAPNASSTRTMRAAWTELAGGPTYETPHGAI